MTSFMCVHLSVALASGHWYRFRQCMHTSLQEPTANKNRLFPDFQFPSSEKLLTTLVRLSELSFVGTNHSVLELLSNCALS